jgi:FkbM family methyltransferase
MTAIAMLTRRFFSLVLRALRADCVCDIGSRDAEESLFFRGLLPDAVVLAFEASPSNYEMMVAREDLRANRIEIFPYAVCSQNGRARFHSFDYQDKDTIRKLHQIPQNEDLEKIERGVGSLFLPLIETPIKQNIEVETRRLDDFILTEYPSLKRIALWIDVEGAEYDVLEGMAKIQDRVVALHVETARTPMRIGQRTTDELLPLLASMGFVPCGSNMGAHDNWGDVVFLSQKSIDELGWKFTFFRSVDMIGELLQKHAPWLDRKLRDSFSPLLNPRSPTPRHRSKMP